MKPTIAQLQVPDQYTLVESFQIDEMNAFVLRELGMRAQNQQAKSPQPVFVVVLAMAILAVAGGWAGYSVASLLMHGNTERVITGIGQLVVSIVGFACLLPIHEGIHGVFFRRVGAPKVGYGGSLKRLMVYAYAQLFVMTLRELAVVAVMPFLFITIGLVLAWLIWPAYGLVWGMVLVLHTLGCIGDFALIRYYYKNRRRPMYTYDDIEGERRSYFFEAVRR